MWDDLFIPGCIINKLNYGVSHQFPATSGHIKSKQHSFPLMEAYRIELCIQEGSSFCVIYSIDTPFLDKNVYTRSRTSLASWIGESGDDDYDTDKTRSMQRTQTPPCLWLLTLTSDLDLISRSRQSCH